jgi:hypothetical protein
VSAVIFAYAAAIAHPLRSGDNDVNRNNRTYVREDYPGKEHEE